MHVFCHRQHACPFEVEGEDNWMGRYFFTGGIMPSLDLFLHFDRDMTVQKRSPVDGTYYRLYHRWRLFVLSCEELFGYGGGSEWLVGHYRFAPRPAE